MLILSFALTISLSHRKSSEVKQRQLFLESTLILQRRRLKSPILTVEKKYPHLIWLVCYASVCTCIEITVGFEMELYTFSEPEMGVSVRIATVCIVVADGSSELGVPLNIQPLWRDGSAIGMPIYS